VVGAIRWEGLGIGHREAKQARQRRSIVGVAAALLREQALEAVTVREIAARADISEATFFNYFGSKESVLCEWAEALVDDAFERAAASEDRVLRRAMRGVCRDVAEAVAADLALARLAFRRVPACADARRASPPRGWRPAAGADRLIERAQARDEVRADWPAVHLAGLLRVAVVHGVAAALAEPSVETTREIAARLGPTADLVLDGFRKRHERVRAATP